MAITDVVKKDVAKLYVSAFGRAPDAEGFKFWLDSYEKGVDLYKMAMYHTQSEEYKKAYADVKTNADFVEKVYMNVLNRASDAEGKKFWVNALDKGMTKAAFLVDFIKGAQGDDVAQIANKADFGIYVAENKIPVDNEKVVAQFKAITSAASTLDSAKKAVESLADKSADAAKIIAALDNLDKANAAKDDYLKTLPTFDKDLNPANNPVGVIEAGKATGTDVGDLLTAAIGKVAPKVNDVAQFSNRSTEVQDLMLKEALTKFETDAAGKAKLAKATTALVEAADAKAKAVKAAGDAKTVADNNFVAETAKLKAHPKNGDLTDNSGDYDDDGTVDNHKFGFNTATPNEFIMMANTEKKVLANKVGSSWELTADGKKLVGVLDFLKAYDAKNAAAEAVTTAEKALKAAVEAIVLAETGAYSVNTLGSVYSGTGSAFNLSAADAKVFMTKADADFTGTKAVYTIDLTGANTGTGSAAKIKFGGVEVTGAGLADSEDAGAIAEKLDGKTVTINTVVYDIARVGTTNKVTLTAQTVADVTASIAIAVENATSGMTSPTTANVAPSTPGETPGSKAKLVDLSKVVDLNNAVKALADFKAEKKTFEEARVWNTKVKELDEKIDAAKKAISNKADDKDAPGLGLKLVDFVVATTATADNDVILFDGKTTATINGFGSAGQDKLFFGKDKYTFKTLDKEVDPVAKEVGDVATLEVFVRQEAADVKLYVEKNKFSGNANGADEYVVITLTGKTVEDLTMADGFVTAGTVA